jgi:GSH-dependent disulfide-bond oxidoreductase
MINVYYWPTPNGHKITMFLEETRMDYRLVPIDTGKEEQFRPQFLAISPNNRMPAIVDQQPAAGQGTQSVVESGAILLYLAEKSGKLLPTDAPGRVSVLQWLFWQPGGLGPMAGQNHHFSRYAPEKLPYAIERYVKETNRLYGVLERRLAKSPYVAGTDYSIADIDIYPWIVPWEVQQQNLEDFPALKRWFEAIAARPSSLRAYARKDEFSKNPVVNDESRKILFGQTAQSLLSNT